MSRTIQQAGEVNEELAHKAHQWWIDSAAQSGINLEGFDPTAPVSERKAWALAAGMSIATVYSRFSSKRQHSTEDQVRECVIWAARDGIYVPPELICVDEAVKGRRVRRDGLERMKGHLKTRDATVLLVYKVSRLFRQAFKGYQLIQEEVVEEGLRAVSVSQGIDTNDKKSWKVQTQVHGLVDDMFIDAISDHVRSGLQGLFENGWTTGALGVGFRRKVLKNAPLTNRLLPRTTPEVDPEVADLIRKHAQLHLDGMPLKEGWRRWLAVGGPCDPRSTTGRMTYIAYRRLWSNIRLTGCWEFGRKRNQFSTKRDYVRQIEQPDSEVATFQCEELRILDDETFLKLQSWLKTFKSPTRRPRVDKPVHLWDLTTSLFFCAACSQPDDPTRLYQTGANGKGMQCKNGDLCPAQSAVRREEAVRAICVEMAEMIVRDAKLIEDVIRRSCELDAQGDSDLRKQITSLEQSIATLTRRTTDLYDLVGDGSDDDRKEIMAKVRAVQAERAARQLDLTRLKRRLAGSTATLTPDDIRKSLADVSKLLEDAAAGHLGREAVYKALAVFHDITGGHIMVHVERRKGRQRTNVRAVFRPHLVRAIGVDAASCCHDGPSTEEVAVWLRKPPRVDALAERVHQLIDVDGLSHRATAKQLQKEGHNVNSGNVWYSYRRYYEMRGQTPPKVPYNNGHKRNSA